MNIEIKKLEGQDVSHFEALVNVFEEVFGMDNFLMPDRSYLQSLLENEHFMVYAAFFGEQVVGGLTAHILPSYYFQSSEVYIYDLAVDAPFQRKGTGRKLVDALNRIAAPWGFAKYLSMPSAPTNMPWVFTMPRAATPKMWYISAILCCETD